MYMGKFPPDYIRTRFEKAYDDAYDVVTGNTKSDEMKLGALEYEKKRLYGEARKALSRSITQDVFMEEQYGTNIDKKVHDHNIIMINDAWNEA